MIQIGADLHLSYKHNVVQMRDKRRPMWSIWREITRTYLPYIHPWLLDTSKSEQLKLNPNYITSEGLIALRTQTAGLMNGITSPTRPWFTLGIGVDPAKLSIAARRYLYQCQTIMYNVLARSNFYNTMASSYFDLGLLNISGVQIFEDARDIVRFQRYNVGEFYVEYDEFGKLVRYAREISLTLERIKQRFGEENMPVSWQTQYKNEKARMSTRKLVHYVERKGATQEQLPHPAKRMDWHEVYWPQAESLDGEVMSVAGYREQPAMFPRWSAELEYGAAPAMDALADMRELGQLILKKGTGLEKMIDPPMLIDAALKNKPKSMIPGGRTYVPNLAEATGARPAYSINLPIQELRLDINDIKLSIREIFHNDLFKMISQLDTVRSATEIDARREEKLVLLAHFLERFENEQLDPTIERVFNICQRKGLFPDPPRDIAGAEIQVQYVSILTTAQRALNTVPMERLLAMVGQVANVEPSVLDIVNWDEFVYTYGNDIGSNPTILRDAEELKKRRSVREQQLEQVEATATAQTAIEGAKNLSETDVGGGANALQRLLAS
jgi:hypothetical protein